MNELKVIRRKLPEIFMQNFCSKVKDWGRKGFQSQEDLYQKMAWPWYKTYHNDNGFEGYMLFISDFIWEFIKYKVDLFENKWRILLRGLQLGKAITT